MNQMSLNSSNPGVKEEIRRMIADDIQMMYISNEYESRIGFSQNDDALQFHFQIENFTDIFKVAGEQLLRKYYPNFKKVAALQGFNLTIEMPTNLLPVVVSAPPEAKKKSREDLAKAIDEIADSLSRFRARFLASPFERAFEAVKEGTAAPKFTFSTRVGERVWCISDAESVSCFFGMSFVDVVDRTIAKLLLDEFTESKRHVKNPPSISRILEDQKFTYPQVLIENFPELKGKSETYLNGLISFTFFKNSHVKGETDEICSYLGSFRQYVHFHVSASKSYLHGRLLKNIATNLKNLNFTKYDQEDERNYRSQRDEILATKSIQEESKRTILKK